MSPSETCAFYTAWQMVCRLSSRAACAALLSSCVHLLALLYQSSERRPVSGVIQARQAAAVIAHGD